MAQELATGKVENLWKIAIEKLRECERECTRCQFHLWKANEGIKELRK